MNGINAVVNVLEFVAMVEEKRNGKGLRAGHRCVAAWPACFIAVLSCILSACATAPSAPAPFETHASATAPVATAQAVPPAAKPVPLAGPFEWNSAVIYFAIVDRFADGDPKNDAKVDRAAKGAFHGGDFAGLAAHLDDIADLGANVLWITPVVKNIDGFVTGAGFPDWAYHGYWADDFTRLDPRFGSEGDLEALVNACHARGIRVLLDVVYNHCGYDSQYLRNPRTRDWLRSNERGDCGQDDITSCVSGLPDFKTERPDVAEFLLDAQIAIAKRTGVDGFRLDTVKHVDHPFWKEHRKRTRERLGAGFFLLGEVWGGDAKVLDPWFEPDELDAGFDFGFQGSTLGFVLGRGRTIAFDRYLKSREKVRAGHVLSHFLSSHDVPGALFQLKGDTARFRLAAVLQMTVSGAPTIYYGEEVARAGGDWPDNRSDMPWGERRILPGAGQPRDEALRLFYKRLVSVRREHPALWRGVHAGVATDGDLYVFSRRDAVSGETLLVAVNRAETPLNVTVPVPEGWNLAAQDLLTGQAVAVDGSGVHLELAPLAARIVATSR